MGITDVSVVRAEGVSMGPEVKGKSLEAANQEIEGLLATAA
jgi:FMN-dependent NADH-azoreductase